ncbi:flavin monoamine oxidase family protein [Phenylobacterium sp.]|uniref:flavin monoamine oxidase family protein n=1 Tax=Phenylobacterium sp. TaxID=1871053 RepID=UPI0027324ED1|nr:FAD-dependent oxidoreductase [Phenylobacterium sp.]MDP3855258.1 FAD-dependent oxidoreductase [Phenylobacterium sp.]
MDRGLSAAGLGVSRRAFLEGLSSVGGSSLLLAGMSALGFGIASAQAAPPVLSGGGGKKVAVLGAGVAGLTAAYELSKAGYDVTVIEARDFAGGRCQTARKGFKLTELGGETQECDFDDGNYINHGPWRIPYHHQSTLHYTKEFNIPLEIFVNDNDASYVMFGRGKGPLAGKPIRKGQVAADIRGGAAEILAKSIKQGALDGQLTAEDRERFVAYLAHEGYLTPDLAYRGAEGRGFDIPPGALMNPGPGKPSTPNRFTDVLQSGAWRTLASVSNYEQQRTMFQPAGGMDRIAKGFEAAIGQLIRYSTQVKSLKQGPKGVEITFVDGDGKTGTLKADYCVCTIPLSVLRQLDVQVSKPFKEAIGAVSYALVGKIGLQMKRRFWEEDHHIYGGHVYFDDPEIQTMTLPSTGFQGKKGVLLGYYNFGATAAKVSALSPAERRALAGRAGDRVFPGYSDNIESAFSASWHLIEHSLGGWAEWSEEARASAYPILCEPDGRVYLAGEHMSYLTGWQAGGIESAWQQIAKLHARVHAA